MDKKDLLTIELFAKLCRTTPRTIRFYDEKGLLRPVLVDEFTKYRYYHPNQARDFFRLKLLQEAQMPIAEIAKTEGKVTLDFLDKKLEEIEEELEQRKKQLMFFRQMKKILFETKNAEALLEKETIGSFVLLCLKNEQGRYDSIGSEITKINQIAKKYLIPITGREMTFYLDPFAYKPKDTVLEIGIVTKFSEIPEDIVLPKGYYFKLFSKTTVRCLTYYGPFGYSALVYQKLHEKRQQRPLLPHEMYFDYNIHGPWDKKSEYDYEMKLCFPLMNQ